MFDVSAIQSAKRNGEFDPISYKKAVKRSPKQGNVCWCTPVTWEGAPIITQRVEFLSILAVDLIMPVKVPRGYSMSNHEQWDKLHNEIYSKEKVVDMAFTQLDDVVRDLTQLEQLTNGSFGDMSIYDDRPDYLEWSTRFEDEWGDLGNFLESSISKLFEITNPHRSPYSRTEDGIGNRSSAPTLEKALANMFSGDNPDLISLIASRLRETEG